MRAVIQRVSHAKVTINGESEEKIKKGIVILLGIEEIDNSDDVEWLAGKISRLRIFNDENGVMNLGLNEINGDAMIISQFTLFASTRKGNRPSYQRAAGHSTAIPLYEFFIESMKSLVTGNVVCGMFGADMQVELINDGPVTIIIDTKNKE